MQPLFRNYEKSDELSTIIIHLHLVQALFHEEILKAVYFSISFPADNSLTLWNMFSSFITKRALKDFLFLKKNNF